ncbi:MAG: hypothetical protein NCW75_07680 [Phycisphaera sp.]|nr:MAG: hypothetical protein NCW75_07680 [Phycisphaera sp.]
MVRGVLALVMVGWCLLLGCGESPTPAAGAPVPVGTTPGARGSIDADLVEAIAQASYQTSPPGHPTLEWAELAPKIEAARHQIGELPGVVKPAAAADPLAERVTSAQIRALAGARGRAMVLRAESARLLAAGYPNAAASELENLLELAQELSAWGLPSAAEASAQMIERALDAMDQPDAAPMTIALATASKTGLREAFEGLDTNDPAGRMRAMTETTAARVEALRSRLRGADGPSAVRAVAGRYVPGAALGTAEGIDRVTREAFAFSRALADGWEKPSRSAITLRLRQRQAEDSTGVLKVLLGEAPDSCDDDARLRERIAGAIEGLR